MILSLGVISGNQKLYSTLFQLIEINTFAKFWPQYATSLSCVIKLLNITIKRNNWKQAKLTEHKVIIDDNNKHKIFYYDIDEKRKKTKQKVFKSLKESKHY